MASPAETLIQRLEAASQWPLEPKVTDRVSFLAALREADEVSLRAFLRWERERDYVPDPLPSVVARAHADLLWGETPEIEPANEADTEQLLAITEGCDLQSEGHRAAMVASSEGEVWWHAYVDRVAADTPQIQFFSRASVIPLWRSGYPLAVALVTIVEATDTEVLRLVAVHEVGRVVHRLYRGTTVQLGNPVPLASHADTETLMDEWRHNLGVMLAGRILNKPSAPGSTLGGSDYQGVERLFLALNEASTIAVEGARLTAKPRLFVDRKYLDERGDFPAGADIFQLDNRDGADGEKAGIVAVQYDFKAQELISYMRDLTDRAVTRAGLVAQWVGASVDGRAETGTALRVRMIPATLTAQGKARYMTQGVRQALLCAQLLDALPVESGGFGRAWTLQEPPSITFKDPVPNDEQEEAQRLSLLTSAEIQSRRTSITELHPEWDEAQVDEEVARLAEDFGGAAVLPEPAQFVGSDPTAASGA